MTFIDTLRQDPDLWDTYTCADEYHPRIVDKYQRIPYALSRRRSILEPVVSKYALEKGYRAEYPEGKRFAVCLTHDIDGIYYTHRDLFKDVLWSLRQKKFRQIARPPVQYLKQDSNPKWNFRNFLSLEERYGATSSFFLLALDPNDAGFSYSVSDLGTEIGEIRDRGWEIGLHGGFNAYASAERISRAKAALERVLGKSVEGYRNHYFQFKIPETWELLKDAGFLYDSTLGYADGIGFRNRLCHPFVPFNLSTGKSIPILEIPPGLMDNTLFDYMRLSPQNAWEAIQMLIDTTERYCGVLTILWHNTPYMEGEPGKLYQKILEYCAGKQAWLTSCSEMYHWWCKDGIPRW